MAHPLTFVCRCEDVPEEEIVNLITEGYSTFSEVKRFLRVGMGHCQGRCCRELVLEIISREKRKEKEKLPPPVIRAPIKPVSMKVLKNLKLNFK